ncbi:MAG TPA: SBBP repeat-containing protein, partial [Bacteroidia bacterium]|nr:SBBP repeat-containing protein [Bacteroidia bacterium]
MKHKLTVFCFTLLLPLLSFAQAVIDACPKGFTTVVKAGPSVKHTLLPRTAAPQAISAAPTNLAIDPGLQQHIAGYFSDRHEPGFEENKGQVSDDNGNPQHEVLFRTKGEGVEIYITTKGITYFFTRTFVDESFQPEPWVNQTEFPALVKHAMTTRYKTEWHRVDMVLQNANISRDAIEKQMPSGVPVRYYMASCPAGVSDVYRYQQLTFRNVYPGIDWVLYQDEAEGMKYEFVVHAGNDASAIQMSFTGAGEISLEENGGLKISSVLGEISENAPVSYLQGSRKTVLTDFLLKKASGEQTIVSFNIGEYDHTKTLVIDPPLVWATYHGGVQTEWLNKMCVDGAGNVYAAGTTNSVNFPLVNPGGGAYFQAVALNSTNITILQFTPAGVITWATCHGGTGQDFVADIVSNPATNSVYVTGFTTSVNMPTQNPLGGAYFQNLYGGGTYDFILLQFNTAGVREWATYIGGSANDSGFSAATDANGNLFYTGFSFSGNFPTVNPGGGAYFDNTLNGQDELVIMKISSTRAMVWSTLYGGNNYDDGTDVAIDATGNVWVGGSSQSTGGTCPVLNPGGTAFFQGANAGGREALLLKFTNNGVQLWGSLYGGSGEDAIYTVTMDVGGNFYCTGFSSTAGAGFPTLNPGGGAYYQAGSAGLQDGIILKFNNNCQRIWATRYGGGNNDNGSDLMLDTGGNLYIVGNTSSINFPTQNPGCTFFQGINGGGYDAFILQFTAATGVRIWATYYGGTAVDYGNGLTTHPSGALFAVGVANSAAIPLVNPGGGAYYQNASAGVQDGFILKFEPTNITTNTVVTNASCNGVCDGSATATSVGGTGPYTYNWTPSGGNNATANNLCAGTYSVYITDNIGCLDTATLTITQPGALLATLASSTNVTCNGFCDGSAT